MAQHNVSVEDTLKVLVETREDVTGVDGFLVHTRITDLLERIADGHVRRERDVLGGHDGACRVLRELQDLIDLASSVRCDVLQDS